MGKMKLSAKRLSLIAAVFSALLPHAACANDVLLEENFDRVGPFGRQLLADPHVKLLRKGGADGSDAIRVAYVGSKEGSERIVIRHPLKKAVEEANLSFDVRFGEDFQWVKGGKLHGLGPENPVTGGNDRAPEKWSARLMFGSEDRTKSYLYEQSPDKKFGIGGTSKAAVFKKAVWHHVVIRVKVNTAGKADGMFSVNVDGKEVNKESAVTFRASDDKCTLISTMLFSTFHGGESPAHAPTDKAGKYTTVYADFDNFTVKKGG
jgi:hypothetical protein